MSKRNLIPLAIVAAVVGLAIVVVAGRARNADANAASAGTWTQPRTPDGQPDLQGIWTNYTNTPFDVFK
jgi:hypothetical protein